MKHIKFIAAAAVLASTSLVSGEASVNAVITTEVTSDVARVCEEWPFCRDVELAEQLTDTVQPQQQAIVRKAV
jgi:hypothetical protein